MHWEQEEGSGKGYIEAGGCIWVSGVVWSSPEQGVAGEGLGWGRS